MAANNWMVLVFALALTACSDPFQKCVDAKQEAFSKANPKASYAVLSTANERFRKECPSSARL